MLRPLFYERENEDENENETVISKKQFSNKGNMRIKIQKDTKNTKCIQSDKVNGVSRLGVIKGVKLKRGENQGG